MDKVKKGESSILRLTRWSVTYSMPVKGRKDTEKVGDTTIFGVDAQGNERIYAQVPSSQWRKWSNTDPLWKQARSVIFTHLLSDPRTRDSIIVINIQIALGKGDEKTAVQLWNTLSESAKAKLMAKSEAK
jgi:hypothetical protein